MFSDTAVTLIKMMGHSGTVPSALLADAVPAALAQLQQALAAPPPAASPPMSVEHHQVVDTDSPPLVGLRLRAFPLIQLLTAAAQQKCDVTWEAGAPLV
jgi:hypothetical protein